MSGWRATICMGCWLVGMSAAPIRAQSPQPLAKTASPRPAWKKKEISFRDAKPVVGLPANNGHFDWVTCSSDGTVFVGMLDSVDAERPMSVYRVTREGDTKQLFRKFPPPSKLFLSEIDVYATEHEFVTVLREERREAYSEGRSPEPRYFISLTELDGSEGELLPLDVKFKPLKIAMFESGGFLLLGWDEVNLIPELALLKDDGSLRRFVDLDNRASDGGLDALSMKGAAKPETVQLLERAKFSAFGKDILLAQPGTASPIHDLSAVGEDRKIPVEYPAGWVMHDVLAGPTQWTLVVRMQPESHEKSDAGQHGNYERLFEVEAAHGSLVREFTFETPSVVDVTCAPAGKIAAMYLQPVPDASQPGAGVEEQKAQQKLELVVATAPR